LNGDIALHPLVGQRQAAQSVGDVGLGSLIAASMRQELSVAPDLIQRRTTCALLAGAVYEFTLASHALARATSGVPKTEIVKAETVKAGPFEIAYQVLGPRQAPPVILLHGGGPGADGWTSFNRNAPALARKFRV
jgi:hypothetical protein